MISRPSCSTSPGTGPTWRPHREWLAMPARRQESSERVRMLACSAKMVIRGQRPRATRAQLRRVALATLEELHRSFVLLRRGAGGERAEVPALPRLRVLRSRVQAVLSRRKFAYHAHRREAAAKCTKERTQLERGSTLSTSAMIVCNPLAPAGCGLTISAIWSCPFVSVARTTV